MITDDQATDDNQQQVAIMDGQEVDDGEEYVAVDNGDDQQQQQQQNVQPSDEPTNVYITALNNDEGVDPNAA